MIKNHVRQLIIRCLSNENFGITQSLVNRVLNVNRHTSYIYRRDYIATGKTHDGRRHNRRPPLIDDEMSNFIKEQFEQVPTASIRDINLKLHERFPHKPIVSNSGIFMRSNDKQITLLFYTLTILN